MIFPEFPAILLDIANLKHGKVMTFKKKYDYDSFVGKKSGKWLITGHHLSNGKTRFFCVCECGKKSVVVSSKIIHKSSLQCVACGARKHGYNKTSTLRCWNGAKNRCNNPNNKDYVNYGGRGIKFSKKWDNFVDFLAYMGDKPAGLTLDRIDNDGNYEPGNCRWATISQQNNNQRKRKKNM